MKASGLGFSLAHSIGQQGLLEEKMDRLDFMASRDHEERIGILGLLMYWQSAMIQRTKISKFHISCPARHANHPSSELRDGLWMKPTSFHTTDLGFVVICKEIG